MLHHKRSRRLSIRSRNTHQSKLFIHLPIKTPRQFRQRPPRTRHPHHTHPTIQPQLLLRHHQHRPPLHRILRKGMPIRHHPPHTNKNRPRQNQPRVRHHTRDLLLQVAPLHRPLHLRYKRTYFHSSIRVLYTRRPSGEIRKYRTANSAMSRNAGPQTVPP